MKCFNIYKYSYDTVPTSKVYKTLKIKIISGISMGRLLNKLYNHTPFNLVSLNENTAEICVIDTAYVFEIKEHYKIYINKSKTEKMMTYKSTSNIIALLMLSFFEASSINQFDKYIEFTFDIESDERLELLFNIFKSRGDNIV